jgi:4-amino-4-deoxy-L-arabinose transferase-like glycosyltransferase
VSEPALAEPAPDVTAPRAARSPGLAAVLVIGVVLLATSAIGGLFEPTETRYAEIAREMNASGDWLVPRLDGIPHLHKPPLAYWASALGMKLLGPDAPGARMPAALAAVGMLAALVCASRRRFAALTGDSQLAIWLLGTSALFVALSRALASDPFLAAGVALFWSCAPSPLALAGIGIGFMAKGPVVLVHTLLPLLVLALIRRDRRPLALLGPAWGWWVAAAIGLPWYLLVITSVPGLLHYFLVHQTWERFTTTVHQRGGPPWYFIAVLIAGLLPWTPMLLAGLTRAFRRLRAPRTAGAEAAVDATSLALAWLLVPLVFFSFSGSKLPAYILPDLPAAALLAASAADSKAMRRACAVLLGALALVGALFGPTLLAKAVALDPGTPLPLPVPMWIALALFALAALACARGRMVGAATLVLAAWASAIVGVAQFEGPLGSPRPAVRLLAAQLRPGEPVIEVETFNAGVPFYLGRTVPLLEVPREQRLGVAAEEVQARTVARSALPELVDRHGRVWLFGPDPAVRQVAEEAGMRFTVLTRWRQRTIGFLSRG